MQIRITQGILHLVIINFIIFVAINLLESKIPHFLDLFTLTKSNLLGFRDVVSNGQKAYYLSPMGILPYGPDDFHWYQIITYFFAHKGFFHFLFNIIALISLGVPVEMVLGTKRFIQFYLFCGIFAGLTTALFDPSNISIICASGAVSGVATAFALFYPNQHLIIFPFPIPIKAKYLVLGFAAFSFIMAIFFPYSGNISHFGHLMGLLGGYLYLRFLQWRLH